MNSVCCGHIIYVQTVWSWGKEVSLRHHAREKSGSCVNYINFDSIVLQGTKSYRRLSQYPRIQEPWSILLLKFRITWSVSLTHWSVVLWHARKPASLVFSRSLSWLCLWTVSRISFSKSLPVVDMAQIVRKCMILTCLQQCYDICFLSRCWQVKKPKKVIALTC